MTAALVCAARFRAMETEQSVQQFLRVNVVLVFGGFLAGLTGCSQKEPGPSYREAPSEAAAMGAQVERDPVAYLERVAQRTKTLDQYTLRLERTERRGLFKTLHGPERIDAWYQREPLAIRLKWVDDDVKYGESVYREATHAGKVRFVTRRWSPPLAPPPQINTVDLMAPVFFGESRRPMTEFGLASMIDQTLASIRESEGAAEIEYLGVVTMNTSDRPAHHFRLAFSPEKFPAPLQDLYIDVETDLPAGSELRTPDEKLDAAYYYYDVDEDVMLTAQDFLLPSEREAEMAENSTMHDANAVDDEPRSAEHASDEEGGEQATGGV